MKITSILWGALGVIYAPVYALSWVLHKLARLLLAIAYVGLLEGRMARDIIKYMFRPHGRI